MSFDIGAQHFSFTDSGHIIDTGYYDFVNNNVDQNESRSIGNQIGAKQTGGEPFREPTTWALMIGGFGLAGAAMRSSAHGRRGPRAPPESHF